MNVIARIHFKGGMLMLPACTPYEIQVLLENLDWYATRYRGVQLEIDRHFWRVEPGLKTSATCAKCQRRGTLTFVNGACVVVCSYCARDAVGSRFADWQGPESHRKIA